MNLAQVIDSKQWMMDAQRLNEYRAAAAAITTMPDQALISARLKSMQDARAFTRGERPQASVMDATGRFFGLGIEQSKDVAIVPISGPIHAEENYVNAMMAVLFGGVGQSEIRAAINAIEQDDSIGATVLLFDTPGGDAFGIAELASDIRAASMRKPIVAYVRGMCASAGYYLASGAGEIISDRMALIGSIGTIITAMNDTEALTKAGFKRTIVTSSQSPHKYADATTPKGLKEYQRMADDMAQVFVEDVAAFHGVKVEKVLSDFGGGAVLIASEAMKVGMIDRISSLSEVVSSLQGQATPKSSSRKSGRVASAPAASVRVAPKTSTPGDAPMSSLLAKMFQRLKAAETNEEIQQIAEEFESSTTEPETTKAAATTPVIGAAAPIPSFEAMKAEVSLLKGQVIAGQIREIEAASSKFVSEKLVGAHILPAEKDSLLALHTQLSRMSAGLPITPGVDLKASLESLISMRPPHVIGSRIAHVPVDARILPNDKTTEKTPVDVLAKVASGYDGPVTHDR